MRNKIETKHLENGRASSKNKHDEDCFASRSDDGIRCFQIK